MHDLPPKTPEMTEERLLGLLTKYGVPYGEWDRPGTKTVQDLLAEITAGEACLVEDGEGLTRVVNGLGLNVFARVNGVLYWLVEAQQEFPDGSTRVRHLSTSLGEKIKNGEDIETAISRALEEELGVDFSDIATCAVGGVEVYPRNSSSRPGLKTTIIMNHAAVELSPSQFKPEGYAEVQPGRKTVHFEWEPILD